MSQKNGGKDREQRSMGAVQRQWVDQQASGSAEVRTEETGRGAKRASGHGASRK